MSFSPKQEGEEAGLVVFYNNEHHYEVLKTKSNGVDVLRVNRRIGDLSSVVYEESANEGEQELCIRASRLEYQLGVYKNGDFIEFAKGRSRYLSTEVTVCSFTGVFFGLYSTSNGVNSTSQAVFHDFDMKRG